MPVLLTNDFPPAIGGIQRYMDRLAFALQDIGCTVCAVAPGPSGDVRAPFAIQRFQQDHGIGRYVQMNRALQRARRYCTDGVTIASTWNPAGVLASRISRNGTTAIFAMGAEIVRQDTDLRRSIMRSTFDSADVIFSISRYTSAQLASAGVRKTPVLVFGGVDAWERTSDPTLRPTILSVGRLVRRKGFDRVIESLTAIRRFHPEVVYEIVGDGPDRAYLEEIAKRCGVADCVRFLGCVEEPSLRAAYERAWCFALPVRRDGHEVEGFGLVYLEAAMAGLPAVGGRQSGAEDAIAHGRTGLIVDGTSGREICDAIELLLRDRDFAAMLGSAARKRAFEEFSWRNVANVVARSVGLPAKPVREIYPGVNVERTAVAAAF